MTLFSIRLLLAVLLCLDAGSAVAARLPSPIPVLVLAEPDAENAGRPAQPIVPAIIALLARESGLDLAVRPYPWRRAQAMAERGAGLLYGAAITPARQRNFLFTRPLGRVNQWLVSTTTAPLAFESWEDVRGKRLSIMSGGKFSSEFEARRDQLFTVSQNASSMTSRIGMLRAGRVDAVMVASYLDAARLEEKLNCLFPGQVRLLVAGRPVAAEPMMLAVPRSAPLNRVYPALDQAARRLVRSHALHALQVAPAGAPPCHGAAAPP